MDADLPGKLPHTYRLGSVTCLAGDVIGAHRRVPFQRQAALVLQVGHEFFIQIAGVAAAGAGRAASLAAAGGCE